MTATEEDVQVALRHLHRPDRLEESRLVRYLRKTFTGASFREAFLLSVESAFQGQPQTNKLLELRDIIYKTDVENAVPRARAAASLGMSYRGFFRKRKQAIRIIVDHINAVRNNGANQADWFYAPASLEISGTREPDNLADGCSRHDRNMDVSAAFEAFSAATASGRVTGDLFSLEKGLAALCGRSMYLTAAQRIEALIVEAEIKLYRHKFSQASSKMDAVFERLSTSTFAQLWPLALYVRAQVAFAVGNVADAYGLAKAADDSPHSTHTIREQAMLLQGRIATMTRRPWHPQPEGGKTEWSDVSIEAVRARASLARGEYDNAVSVAQTARERSLQHGFLPVAAYCEATLAGCYAALVPDKRGASVANSLKLLGATSYNAFVARDLFQFGLSLRPSAAWLEPSIDDELARIFLTLTPASAFSPVSPHIIAAFIRTILIRMSDPASAVTGDQAIAELAELIRGAGTSSALLSKEHPNLAEFGDFLKVLVPITRQPTFSRSFSAASGYVLRALIRQRSYHNIRALSVVS